MKKNIELELRECPTGFSIWFNKLWVVDASTFLDDHTIEINLDKMKKISKKGQNIEYILKI